MVISGLTALVSHVAIVGGTLAGPGLRSAYGITGESRSFGAFGAEI